MKSKTILLFLFSSLVWVVSDIPTQYRIRKLMKDIDSASEGIPEKMMRLLKLRLWISLAGVVPFLAVFILMVNKPEITPVALWFR